MKFCDKCGSYMTETSKGFSCTKCGNLIPIDIVEVKQIKQSEESPVDVVDDSKKEKEYAKANETCPQCGNSEAFHSLGLISGEHAGVRQERSMERFTCTKCGHSWTK